MAVISPTRSFHKNLSKTWHDKFDFVNESTWINNNTHVPSRNLQRNRFQETKHGHSICSQTNSFSWSPSYNSRTHSNTVKPRHTGLRLQAYNNCNCYKTSHHNQAVGQYINSWSGVSSQRQKLFDLQRQTFHRRFSKQDIAVINTLSKSQLADVTYRRYRSAKATCERWSEWPHYFSVNMVRLLQICRRLQSMLHLLRAVLMD